MPEANGTNRLPPPKAAAGTAFLVTTPRSSDELCVDSTLSQKDPAMQRVMVRRDACRTRSSADHQMVEVIDPCCLGGQAKGSAPTEGLCPSDSAVISLHPFRHQSDDCLFALTGPRRLKKPAGVSASWTAATFPAQYLYAQR